MLVIVNVGIVGRRQCSEAFVIANKNLDTGSTFQTRIHTRRWIRRCRSHSLCVLYSSIGVLVCEFAVEVVACRIEMVERKSIPTKRVFPFSTMNSSFLRKKDLSNLFYWVGEVCDLLLLDY